MEKKLPFKNYILLSIVLIITIIITILFFKLYANNEKNNALINDEYLRIINYNEIDNYLVENKDVVIYISSPSDKKMINFEKEFKNIITKYALNNNILSLNIEDNSSVKIKNDKIVVPSIVIYKDGKIDSLFDLKKNNYSTKKLKEYLKEKMIIND